MHSAIAARFEIRVAGARCAWPYRPACVAELNLHGAGLVSDSLFNVLEKCPIATTLVVALLCRRLPCTPLWHSVVRMCLASPACECVLLGCP
eukprot:11897162-Alexandrium_andersonii.AAC.2